MLHNYPHARNLTASFALLAMATGGAAMAQETEAPANDDVAGDSEYSFSCDAESYAGQNMTLQEVGPRVMAGNVFIQAGPEVAMPSFVAPPAEGQPPTQQRRSSSGSGFIIDADQGYIVTNAHVVLAGQQDTEGLAFTVTLYDPDTVDNKGQQFRAELVGIDGLGRDEVDLAVLQIDTDEPLTCVHFGDSDNVRQFDYTFAIGNGLGQTFSPTFGIISNVMRSEPSGNIYHEMIQTDATINRGNSGGALYNMDGEVIGVPTSILSPSGGSIGIGFAIPSNVVVEIADRLITDGEYLRGWLGVSIQDVDEPAAARLDGAEEGRGALVTNVGPDSPAEGAGLQTDDIILGIDGYETNSSSDLVRGVGRIRPGDAASFSVLRGGEMITVDVVIAERTAEAQQELQGGEEQEQRDPFMIIPEDEKGETPEGEKGEAPESGDDNGDDTAPGTDEADPSSGDATPLPHPGQGGSFGGGAPTPR